MTQPMGGGVPTDIISGQPRSTKTEDQLLAEAKLKEQQAIQEASLLIQELNNSPVLDVLAKQLQLRLVVLAKEDAICQAFLKIIDGLDYKLSALHQARKLVHQRMGPFLSQFLEETEAAPE